MEYCTLCILRCFRQFYTNLPVRIRLLRVCDLSRVKCGIPSADCAASSTKLLYAQKLLHSQICSISTRSNFPTFHLRANKMYIPRIGAHTHSIYGTVHSPTRRRRNQQPNTKHTSMWTFVTVRIGALALLLALFDCCIMLLWHISCFWHRCAWAVWVCVLMVHAAFHCLSCKYLQVIFPRLFCYAREMNERIRLEGCWYLAISLPFRHFVILVYDSGKRHCRAATNVYR